MIVLPLVAFAAVRNRIIVVGLTVTIGIILYYLFLEATLQLLYTNYIESEYSSEGAAIRVALNVVPAVLFLIFSKKIQSGRRSTKIMAQFFLGRDRHDFHSLHFCAHRPSLIAWHYI